MLGFFFVLAVVLVVGGFFVLNAVHTRDVRRGVHAVAMGSWLGTDVRRGDPMGHTRRLPAVEGVRREPLQTGTFGSGGGLAVVEERTSSEVRTLFHLWIDAGLDADIYRSTAPR